MCKICKNINFNSLEKYALYGILLTATVHNIMLAFTFLLYSDEVERTKDLMDNLNYSLNATRETQQRVKTALSLLKQQVLEISKNLSQVDYTSMVIMMLHELYNYYSTSLALNYTLIFFINRLETQPGL